MTGYEYLSKYKDSKLFFKIVNAEELKALTSETSELP